VICAFHSARAGAQVIAFEASGSVFPEAASTPWTRVGTNNANRWFENGLFCQFVTNPNNFGQFDGYKRTFGELAGSPSFFVAWREMTDCPRSDIDGAPSGLAANSSTGHIDFTFYITRDLVRFIRDNPIGLVLYVDIAPDVMHSYYLALQSDLSYSWYIDGVVVNSGQYPSAFPTVSAQLIWAAAYWAQDHTTKWEYVRYGVIPPDNSGDFNNNGAVDETDVYYFVDCLLGPDYDAAGPGCKWADMNADGSADGADVQLFVTAMTGG
jgi:hypothetical protein